MNKTWKCPRCARQGRVLTWTNKDRCPNCGLERPGGKKK